MLQDLEVDVNDVVYVESDDDYLLQHVNLPFVSTNPMRKISAINETFLIIYNPINVHIAAVVAVDQVVKVSVVKHSEAIIEADKITKITTRFI